jgi:hypothetical protein
MQPSFSSIQKNKFNEFHIHGCEQVCGFQGDNEVIECPDEAAEFFGVYVRYTDFPEIEWIADFNTREEAEAFVTLAKSLISNFQG